MALTEKETRRQIIDRNVRLAGWNVDDPSQVSIELPVSPQSTADRPTEVDPHFIDYVFNLHNRPVAVIEAKRASKDAQAGQEQALQYAENLTAQHGSPVPFAIYTNGFDSYFWEHEFYPPAKVHGFPTRDDLEWMLQRREDRRPLSVEMINTSIAGRDYILAAIRSILEGVEAKRRKFLLVMATGTGKTRTAIALMDVLMRARWAKRVLFLVDRITLRDQARDDFRDHLPSVPRWPDGEEKAFDRSRRCYVATYPTMLNLIQNGSTPSSWLSPFFFDVIIADESHRSIYNTYKQVLDYFHAITIGLTATPKDQVGHDTYDIFECEHELPTFAYTYQEAIAHDPPYLCDFESLKIRSKFQRHGIKGKKLSVSEQKKLVAEGKDPQEIDFEGTDLERKVTNSGTNVLIIREFMEECIKDASGTLPGKTIIFAISKSHARRLHTVINDLYPEHKGRLAKVIVSEDSRAHGKGGLIDQFKTKDMPRIAISVDMLDTGFDCREVVNLVFAKPVFSVVKFWQMIGRGTRVLDPERLKPWCIHKDKFLIIDCWENFKFFKETPKGKEPEQQIPMPERLFRARLDKVESALALKRNDIVTDSIRGLRLDIAALPSNNVVVLENRRHLEKTRPDDYWDSLDWEGIQFLRATISPIFRARSNADFKAMRFETEVVELGTAWLNADEEQQKATKASIRNQIEELPLSVNVVGRQRTLIDSAKTDDWWKQPTNDKLNQLIDNLAPLMQYRERRSGGDMVELGLTDLTVEKEFIEFGAEQDPMAKTTYRSQIEEYVRQLVDANPVLQRIQAAEPVTEAQIDELAIILAQHELPITEALLQQAYDNKRARFIEFIRCILARKPIESWPQAITREFDDYIAEHNTFTELQIRFLQTLRTFILQTGRIEKQALVKDPFTGIHPRGIRGLFKPEQIDDILRFAQSLITSPSP